MLFCLSLPSAAQEQADGPAMPGCTDDYELVDESHPFLRQTPLTSNQSTTLVVDSIHYSRLQIFDESNPDENNALFRWANQFHLLTRQNTIRQLLLFEEEDQIEGRLLEETARVLRNQDYFFDADLRLLSNCNQRVAVEVITKDTWSLTPNISFDRSGGENTYSVGLSDSNFLGRGKQLSIARSKDLDRITEELAYEDPNVFGTWIRNRTLISDSDDGSRQLFDLSLPFYALDSRRSWGVLLENDSRIDEQFFLGNEVSEVQHDIELAEASLGWSEGLINGQYVRWTAGLRFRKDRFKPGPNLPAPDSFPVDRELVYPFLQLQLGQDNFVTAFNFDEIYRTEDLYLGHLLKARIGYAAEGLGSDKNRIVMEGSYSDTLYFDGQQLWQFSLNLESLVNLDSNHSEDAIVSLSTRYFNQHSRRWSFFARMRGSYANNLSREKQFFMGGESGVRAFDNRFQVGDRNLVINLEERIYTDLHVLNLIRVGGALFVDIGRSWKPGTDSGLSDPWLANVGFGLRLMSSKAASSRIAHLDFAFPITNRDNPAVDNVQIAFSIKGRF